MVGAVLLMTAIGIGACTFGPEDAKAAPDQRIETFNIVADTFFLRADALPTIDVDGGTTTYTISSGDTTIFFTQVGSSQQSSFDLKNGDRVIERPDAAMVTLIREI
jgi:hypothetical protein